MGDLEVVLGNLRKVRAEYEAKHLASESQVEWGVLVGLGLAIFAIQVEQHRATMAERERLNHIDSLSKLTGITRD